jgi:uncharacterized membrane protein YczE
MTNKDIATVRTTVNTTVLSLVALVLSRLFSVTIDVTDPLFVGTVLLVTPVFYRASLWASDKWPAFGYILFGKNAKVNYD